MAEEFYWPSKICMYESQFVGLPSTLIILSLIALRQAIAVSILKILDSVVKSTLFAIDSRCVRQNDQIIDQFEVRN